MATPQARGVIYIHSSPPALCPHLEWAVGRALGRAVSFDWADQPVLAEQAARYCGCNEPGASAFGERVAEAVRAQLNGSSSHASSSIPVVVRRATGPLEVTVAARTIALEL